MKAIADFLRAAWRRIVRLFGGGGPDPKPPDQ